MKYPFKIDLFGLKKKLTAHLSCQDEVAFLGKVSVLWGNSVEALRWVPMSYM